MQERADSVSKTEGEIEDNTNKEKLLTAEIEQGAANIAALSKDILDLDTTA